MDFVKGNDYHLVAANQSSLSPPGEVTFIREEYLPKTGEYWQTFYMVLGEEDNKIFVSRLRIPSSSITEVIDETITFDGILEPRIVWRDQKHNLTVDSWLAEVDEIELASLSAREA